MGGFFSQPKRTTSASEMPTMAAPSMPTVGAPSMGTMSTPDMGTIGPTTMAPTTMAPTTMAPTTMAPTTMAPTTMAPRPPPTITFYKTGYIYNNTNAVSRDSNGNAYPNASVYTAPAGTLANDTNENMAKKIPGYLTDNNLTFDYDYIVMYDNGSFELHKFMNKYLPDPFTTPGDKFNMWNKEVPAVTYSAKQSGSISKFGAGGGSGMLILLLLLLVAAVVYYLYTQGKIKIPTFEQRMASFGKAIKSLRRRR